MLVKYTKLLVILSLITLSTTILADDPVFSTKKTAQSGTLQPLNQNIYDNPQNYNQFGADNRKPVAYKEKNKQQNRRSRGGITFGSMAKELQNTKENKKQTLTFRNMATKVKSKEASKFDNELKNNLDRNSYENFASYSY